MAYCTECGRILANTIFCSFCGTKTFNRHYESKPPDTNDERELIEHYFKRGYGYDFIVIVLQTYHGIEMCNRTLKIL